VFGKKNGGKQNLKGNLFFIFFSRRRRLALSCSSFGTPQRTKAENARPTFLHLPFFEKIADALASIRDKIQAEGTPDTYRPLEVL
jgi:hypothetical protein